jgi:hypothetical protein
MCIFRHCWGGYHFTSILDSKPRVSQVLTGERPVVTGCK